MPTGQICGLGTYCKPYLDWDSFFFFYLDFVSPTLMCTEVMYAVSSEYQC